MFLRISKIAKIIVLSLVILAQTGPNFQKICGKLYKGVTHRLLESNKLGMLVTERFELRRRLETRMSELRKLARSQAYQDVIFGNLDSVKIRVGDGYQFRYDNDIYPCNRICGRSNEFNKHYYENAF